MGNGRKPWLNDENIKRPERDEKINKYRRNKTKVNQELACSAAPIESIDPGTSFSFLQTNIDLPILSHSPNQCDSTCSTATLSSQLSATSAEESDDESNVLEFNDQFDIIEDRYTEKNNDAEYRSLLLAITTMYFAANLTRDSTELLTTLIQLITKCKMPKSFKTIVNHLIEHEFPIEKKF